MTLAGISTLVPLLPAAYASTVLALSPRSIVPETLKWLLLDSVKVVRESQRLNAPAPMSATFLGIVTDSTWLPLKA